MAQGQAKAFFADTVAGACPAWALHHARHAETSVTTWRKASESATWAAMASDNLGLAGSWDSVGVLTFKSTGAAGNG